MASQDSGDGRLTFANTGDQVRVLLPEPRELPSLRDLGDEVLAGAEQT